jgi:hypothetical protein
MLARGIVMNQPGKDFLSHTTFTINEHRQFCWCYLNGYVNAAVQPLIVAHNSIALFGLLYSLIVHEASFKVVTKLAIILDTTMTFCQFLTETVRA